MSYLHCNECHHEWEGEENSQCSWCGGGSYILEQLTPLEKMNVHKLSSYVSEIRFNKVLEYQADDETFFFRVIKAAFGNRRKTLKNSLSASGLNIGADLAKHVLESSGIDPVRRAETLNTEEFVKVSNNLLRVL